MRWSCRAVLLLPCLVAVVAPSPASAQGSTIVDVCKSGFQCIRTPVPTGPAAYPLSSAIRGADPLTLACAAGEDNHVPVGDASVTACTAYREGPDGREFNAVVIELGGHVIVVTDGSHDSRHGCGSSAQDYGLAVDGDGGSVAIGETGC